VLFTQVERGLHYNIPAPATITINDGNTRLLTTNASLGQFGSIGFLPVSTGSRRLHQEVTLDGTSGALLRVQNASNAFDPQLINRTGEAIGSAIDAFDPKVKAEREAAIAKARFEKLEAEQKIHALGQPVASGN
jgi:hypothetical protein